MKKAVSKSATLKLERVKLAELLKDISKTDLDMTGFNESEITRLIAGLGGSGETPDPQLDRAEELRKKWGTERGQLWKIGDHRLLCGDCLVESDVYRVMGGGKWDVAVIDPPFERNDLPHISDPSIVFGQAKHVRMIPEDLFRFERVIDKGVSHRSATVNIGHRHAFVVQCGSVKTLPHSKETYPSIVVCDTRPDHPHEKSAALLMEHLSLWTPPWKIAFDPFCGSGTTLVVCEQMKRAGRGIEIDPSYVSVALERLSKMGLNPKLKTDDRD